MAKPKKEQPLKVNTSLDNLLKIAAKYKPKKKAKAKKK
jgi:hypothetical protein